MPPDTSLRYGPREVAALLVLSGSWGLSFLFIGVALRGLTPLWIVAGRTAVGGVVLLVALRVTGHHLPRSWSTWRHLLIIGSITNALPWSAVAWAQQSLPSGLTALLMALVPLSTLLVSAAIGAESLTRARTGGLVLALIGVGLIVAGDLDEAGRLVAILAVVGATMMYALGTVYARRHLSGRWPPLVLATGQVLTATAVAVPVAVLASGPPETSATAPQVVVAVLALGIFGTGLAFLLFYLLIERVGATNATLTTYLIPLVAVSAGAVVLGERLHPGAIAGGLTIGVGIWLTQRVVPGTLR